MASKKIAVLGGGMGSLTAVIKLTEDPSWKQKYDITVYQMGWRLGGKGASGRNAEIGQRIEEHGLHLWFGFYDNAFDLIQKCYTENNRPAGTPLATWQDAFLGYDFICLQEQIENEWLHWPITLPANNVLPGWSQKQSPTEGYIYQMIEGMIHLHYQFNAQKSEAVKVKIQLYKDSSHMDDIRDDLKHIVTEREDTFADAGEYILTGALILAKDLLGNGKYDLLIKLLQKLKEWLIYISQDLLKTDTFLRRFFIMADLGICTIVGMIMDGVLTDGFDVINNYDYRDWLVKHEADPITANSAIVQAVYGLVFGGKNQYTFEAGTALRGLLRMGLTYKGHVYYRMMAGMGDAIFAPIYEVLVKRGVKFEFFSKITNLKLTDDKKAVACIEIDVQATLAAGISSYPALVTVNDLPCWPNMPDFKSLEQGDQLKEQAVNLESYYSTWQPVAKKTLTSSDFDEVILGISIGALPTVASELIANSTAWQNMIKNVIPISTIAFQLWLNSSIGKMEWPFNASGLALVGSYQEPYDTWADMSDLINREVWPDGYTPKNIAYFCGPIPAPFADQILNNALKSDFSDTRFPAEQKDVATDYASQYIAQLSSHLWPGISPGNNQFDYSTLIDLNNGTGAERFKSQFFRANIDPTELYVMSFTGSSDFRLKTDESGYSNLFITGDWINNGFNAGCIEATVMSGLQTARAMMGVNFAIPGENDPGRE